MHPTVEWCRLTAELRVGSIDHVQLDGWCDFLLALTLDSSSRYSLAYVGMIPLNRTWSDDCVEVTATATAAAESDCLVQMTSRNKGTIKLIPQVLAGRTWWDITLGFFFALNSPRLTC